MSSEMNVSLIQVETLVSDYRIRYYDEHINHLSGITLNPWTRKLSLDIVSSVISCGHCCGLVSLESVRCHHCRYLLFSMLFTKCSSITSVLGIVILKKNGSLHTLLTVDLQWFVIKENECLILFSFNLNLSFMWRIKLKFYLSLGT